MDFIRGTFASIKVCVYLIKHIVGMLLPIVALGHINKGIYRNVGTIWGCIIKTLWGEYWALLLINDHCVS